MKPSQVNRTIYEVVTLDDPHNPITVGFDVHHDHSGDDIDGDRMDTSAVTALVVGLVIVGILLSMMLYVFVKAQLRRRHQMVIPRLASSTSLDDRMSDDF